jgi:ABC-type spermidine/putrescine transport system permease subunit I
VAPGVVGDPGGRVATSTGTVGERRSLWPAFAAPGVMWLILLFLTPFYAILAVAMGRLDPVFSSAEPVWNPLEWDPAVFGELFGQIFGGSLGMVFLRTIVFVVLAAALCVLIGYPVAYFVSRRAGRWKVPLLILLVAPFWINYLMRMLAWQGLLDTEGYVNQTLQFLGFIDQPVAWLAGRPETVILGLVYGYIPFFILPLYAALDRIDPTVIEAARDLGASPFQAFRRVTLPLSKQGILAGLVLITLPMFGDYYTPNLMALGNRAQTLLIGNQIQLFIQSGVGEATGAALTVVLMAFVSLLMIYYLVTVARASREARA